MIKSDNYEYQKLINLDVDNVLTIYLFGRKWNRWIRVDENMVEEKF